MKLFKQQLQQPQLQQQQKSYFQFQPQQQPQQQFRFQKINHIEKQQQNKPQQQMHYDKKQQQMLLQLKRLYTDQLRFKMEEEENDELIVQEKLKDQSSILTKEFLENNFKQSLDFKYVDKYYGRQHRVVLCMPNKIALIKD